MVTRATRIMTSFHHVFPALIGADVAFIVVFSGGVQRTLSTTAPFQHLFGKESRYA